MKRKSKISIAEQIETLKMKRTAKIISESEYQKQIHLLEADTATIAANLTKAYNAGPAAMRAYLDGPEGSSEEARALLQKQGADNDGDASDDKIFIGKGSGAALSFFPTQNEIDLMQSMSYPLGSLIDLIAAITSGPTAAGIVTSGNLVIDGHHRWSGAIGIGGDNAQVDSTDIQWPGKNIKKILAAAQLTIVAKNNNTGKTPSQSAKFNTNILGVSKDKIVNMIMDHINIQTDKGAHGELLNDQMMEDLTSGVNKDINIVLKWLGDLGDRIKDKVGLGKPSTPEAIYGLRLAIAQKVAINLIKIPKPSEDIVRADMPQFDDKAKPAGPKAKTVTGDLEAGNFNVAPPFAKESKNRILTNLEAILQESIATWKKNRRK